MTEPTDAEARAQRRARDIEAARETLGAMLVVEACGPCRLRVAVPFYEFVIDPWEPVDAVPVSPELLAFRARHQDCRLERGIG